MELLVGWRPRSSSKMHPVLSGLTGGHAVKCSSTSSMKRGQGGELERFVKEKMNDNLLQRPSLVNWLEGEDRKFCDNDSEDKIAVDDKESI